MIKKFKSEYKISYNRIGKVSHCDESIISRTKSWNIARIIDRALHFSRTNKSFGLIEKLIKKYKSRKRSRKINLSENGLHEIYWHAFHRQWFHRHYFTATSSFNRHNAFHPRKHFTDNVKLILVAVLRQRLWSSLCFYLKKCNFNYRVICYIFTNFFCNKIMSIY